MGSNSAVGTASRKLRAQDQRHRQCDKAESVLREDRKFKVVTSICDKFLQIGFAYPTDGIDVSCKSQGQWEMFREIDRLTR